VFFKLLVSTVYYKSFVTSTLVSIIKKVKKEREKIFKKRERKDSKKERKESKKD
jgi:hypothetical protein